MGILTSKVFVGRIVPKPVLRIELERILGKTVSDRTWDRVKVRLKLKPNDLSRFPDIQTYARMKKISPRSNIDLRHVEIVNRLLDEIASSGADSEELKRAIAIALKKPPSDRTLYRWGKEIGVPMSTKKRYGPDELVVWAMKLVSVLDPALCARI